MTIEIICSGGDNCHVLRGKICQALADLNLAADVISVYDPQRVGKFFLPGHPGLVIDGKPVAMGDHCTVGELKHLLDAKAIC